MLFLEGGRIARLIVGIVERSSWKKSSADTCLVVSDAPAEDSLYSWLRRGNRVFCALPEDSPDKTVSTYTRMTMDTPYRLFTNDGG